MESATDVFEEARRQREKDAKDGDQDGAGDSPAGDAGETADADGAGTSDEDGAGDGAGDEQATADAKGGGGGTPSDDALNGALEDFDGKILSERGSIAQRANDNAAEDGDSGAAGDSGDGDAKGKASGAPSGISGSGGGMPSTQPLPDRKAPPFPSSANSTAQAEQLPPDLPDAKDDDVVARQLREAAINETDPVMQEKLWEEYRRYKTGS